VRSIPVIKPACCTVPSAVLHRAIGVEQLRTHCSKSIVATGGQTAVESWWSRDVMVRLHHVANFLVRTIQVVPGV
jgi:hypothetical protein